MVGSKSDNEIIVTDRWKYALFAAALFGGSVFGLYIVYDSAQQFFISFANQSDVILVPYGYSSLLGASIVTIWFGVALIYEKVANKPVRSGIIKITKYMFLTGLILMIVLPILFKTISELQLGDNGYTKCNSYESRGTNKWVKNKNLC